MGPARSQRTRLIEAALHRMASLDESKKRGLRAALAKRVGLSPQRITNVAKRIGMTNPKMKVAP